MSDNCAMVETVVKGITEASVTMYIKSTDAADLITELAAENAKLRELAYAVREFVEDTHCEDCPHRRDCYDNNIIFCAKTFSYNAFAAMRKLEGEWWA